MKILIVEDEELAVEKLQMLLQKTDVDITSCQVADSVSKAIQLLQSQQHDLVFLDIHLADGLSFEIFQQIEVETPIIFTTAYDQYAIQAFKHNSIDYLLKPINLQDLSFALQKYQKQQHDTQPALNTSQLEELKNIIGNLKHPSYQERFLVYAGKKIKYVPVNEVAYFFSQEKATFLVTHQNRLYTLNYTLSHIETITNPKIFCRINRWLIANISAVQEIIPFSKHKFKVALTPSPSQDVFISAEKILEVKRWVNQ